MRIEEVRTIIIRIFPSKRNELKLVTTSFPHLFSFSLFHFPSFSSSFFFLQNFNWSVVRETWKKIRQKTGMNEEERRLVVIELVSHSWLLSSSFSPSFVCSSCLVFSSSLATPPSLLSLSLSCTHYNVMALIHEDRIFNRKNVPDFIPR